MFLPTLARPSRFAQVVAFLPLLLVFLLPLQGCMASFSKRLLSDRPAARASALDDIASLGPEGPRVSAREIEGLVAALDADDSEVRSAAVRALELAIHPPQRSDRLTRVEEALRSPHTLTALVNRVSDSDTEVQLGALRALGRYEHDEIRMALAGGEAALLETLQDEDAPVRVGVFGLLQLSPTISHIGPYLDLLDDPDPDLKRRAAVALAEYGDHALRDAFASKAAGLASAFADGDAVLHDTLVDLLTRVKHPSILGSILPLAGVEDPELAGDAVSVVYTYPESAVAAAVGDAMPALFAAAESPEARVRLAAARWMRLSDDASTIAPLVVMLTDADGLVRGEALAALFDQDILELHDRLVPEVQGLLAATHVEEAEFTAEVIRLLGIAGQPDTAQPLVEFFHSESPEVVRAARDSIVAIGAPAVELLQQGLEDEEPQVRQTSAEALSRMGEPVFDLLIEGLDHEDSLVRAEFVRALSGLGDARAVAPLIRRIPKDFACLPEILGALDGLDPEWTDRKGVPGNVKRLPGRCEKYVQARSNASNPLVELGQFLGARVNSVSTRIPSGNIRDITVDLWVLGVLNCIAGDKRFPDLDYHEKQALPWSVRHAYEGVLNAQRHDPSKLREWRGAAQTRNRAEDAVASTYKGISNPNWSMVADAILDRHGIELSMVLD